MNDQPIVLYFNKMFVQSTLEKYIDLFIIYIYIYK